MNENKFDKLFKDSLSNHEMPYDAAAWSALDKKITAKGKGGNWKWFASGAAIVVVAVSAVYFSNTEIEPTALIEKASNDEQAITPTSSNTIDANESSLAENKKSASNSFEAKNSQYSQNELTGPVSGQVGQVTNNNEVILRAGILSHLPVQNQEMHDEPARKINFPTVGEICENEVISIHNINGEDLYLIAPNGSKSTLKSHQNSNFKGTDAGNYTIARMENGKVVESTQFTVKQAPKVDLYYDNDIKYTNGVPTTGFSTNANGELYQWNFGKVTATSNDQTAVANFFHKGMHSVSLTVTSNNGCKSTETVKVNIEENYNLLAVDAFNPNSNIEANQTFMPIALIERNIGFKLMIIEPNSGAVIYETSDVSQPWNGVDKRNGQMALPGKTFLWKVSLDKALPGESANYAGSVIVTSNR
ncbi:MAG: PKD domain-containing protein [Bacteroidota bacterium]